MTLPWQFYLLLEVHLIDLDRFLSLNVSGHKVVPKTPIARESYRNTRRGA